MRIGISLLLAVACLAQGEKRDEPVDVGKILRESSEFAAKCADYRVSYGDGIVRSEGEIYYRGGGPCEYLVGVFPAKAHETIVLLDKGPWDGDGRRPREPVRGLAEVLNNAFLAADFKKGKPFSWDQETGETFPPQGEVVHIYAEWKDEQGKLRRARMSDWLWNFKLIEVMAPGKFVYTGSVLLDEGPPDHKKWLGAELDGLVTAVLNTSTALMDNIEDGGLDNGAYEAIPIRIPESGTRVSVAFSKTELEITERYPPLKLPPELIEEKKRREAEKAKQKQPKDEK
jgi:hypothetical protein